MKEFAYLKKDERINNLGSNTAILKSPTTERFLVANDESLNALIYAPEIDFYIKNTTNLDCVKVNKLYEARAINYDYSKEIELNANISKDICILFSDDDLAKSLNDAGFNAICISEFEYVFGGIGSFSVKTSDNELNFSLALAKKDLDNPAIINVENKNPNEIINVLNNMTGHVNYKKSFIFNNSLCQLDGRRSEHCNWCVKVCPSVALSSIDNQILESQIDCIDCAKCVSVCPTNALDFCSYTKDGFWQLSKLYEDEQIIITDDYSKSYDLDGFLPFHINIDLLDELMLLHLINITQKPIVLIANISEFLAEKVRLVNDICQAIAKKDGVINTLAKSPKESRFYSSESNFRLNKRELFGRKILSMMDNDDLGEVNAKDYAIININEDNCTLCAACAGACNTNAILADTKQNAITFNASLCTSCGYCISSCAESDTISMQKDILKLNKNSFTHQILARDELFACIECGKEFATKKSIDKIAGILGASFSLDITKKYSLYCCADCKAKIQMLKQANVFNEDKEFLISIEEKLNNFLKV